MNQINIISLLSPFLQSKSVDQNGKYDDMEESMEVEKDLESLVEMLIHEEQSGHYFLNYLHTQQNQVKCSIVHFLLHCINFLSW